MAETPPLFDPIAPGYDRVSAAVSLFGIRAWHRAAVCALAVREGQAVLDVGSGTGAVTRSLARAVGPKGRVVGLDPSPGMLAEARRGDGPGIGPEWVLGRAEALPFPNASFDAVTAQFSLRNMQDWRRGVEEMARVLRPGGRLVVLDLLRPVTTRGALAMKGLGAATEILAATGLGPYRWLERSLLHAPYAADVKEALGDAGLYATLRQEWLGDLVTLLAAERPVEAAVRVEPAAHEARVLWATDGSAAAEAAGEWLLRHWPDGAVVDVVTVRPPLPPRDREPLQDPDRSAWEHVLMRARERLPAGRIGRLELLEGVPGPTLTAYVAATRPDLVLVGMTHREAGAERILGSVGAYLQSHVDCPLTAVPQGCPERHGPRDATQTPIHQRRGA